MIKTIFLLRNLKTDIANCIGVDRQSLIGIVSAAGGRGMSWRSGLAAYRHSRNDPELRKRFLIEYSLSVAVIALSTRETVGRQFAGIPKLENLYHKCECFIEANGD